MLFLDMGLELFLVAITSQLVQVPWVVSNAKSAFPGLVRHVPILVDIDVMPGETLKVGDISLAELALDWHFFRRGERIALYLSFSIILSIISIQKND
jgi:hypothetical protein